MLLRRRLKHPQQRFVAALGRLFVAVLVVVPLAVHWSHHRGPLMPEAIINLAEVMRKASTDDFWSARGQAVQAYATLEQSMCSIFSELAGVTREIGGVIFFRISSADARNKIVEKLFRKQFGDQFNLFRNSLIADLRPIDQERNEIVHWNVYNDVRIEKGTALFKLKLRPPATWGDEILTAPIKDTDDLVNFCKKCSFYSRLCNMLKLVLLSDIDMMSVAEKQPWLDIFAQPITYPPPEAHPLFPKPQEPAIQPEPSEE